MKSTFQSILAAAVFLLLAPVLYLAPAQFASDGAAHARELCMDYATNAEFFKRGVNTPPGCDPAGLFCEKIWDAGFPTPVSGCLLTVTKQETQEQCLLTLDPRLHVPVGVFWGYLTFSNYMPRGADRNGSGSWEDRRIEPFSATMTGGRCSSTSADGDSLVEGTATITLKAANTYYYVPYKRDYRSEATIIITGEFVDGWVHDARVSSRESFTGLLQLTGAYKNGKKEGDWVYEHKCDPSWQTERMRLCERSILSYSDGSLQTMHIYTDRGEEDLSLHAIYQFGDGLILKHGDNLLDDPYYHMICIDDECRGASVGCSYREEAFDSPPKSRFLYFFEFCARGD